MPPTPARDRLAHQVSANARWAAEPDRDRALEPAHRGFRERFEREVDPDGELTPAERQARAAAALRAHMGRLSIRSAERRAAAKNVLKRRRKSRKHNDADTN